MFSSTPRLHFTPEKTRYPFYRRLGGPQGWSGRAENLVPTEIRSRTVQPVAQSLYRLSYPAHKLYECFPNIHYNVIFGIINLLFEETTAQELAHKIFLHISFFRGPGSSVGIATVYRLDGPGIESRWGRDFPHLSRPALGLTQPPVQ